MHFVYCYSTYVYVDFFPFINLPCIFGKTVKPDGLHGKLMFKKVFNQFPCVLAFLPVTSFEINSSLIASIVKKKIRFFRKKVN